MFDLLESNKTLGYQELFNFVKSNFINNLCSRFMTNFCFKTKIVKFVDEFIFKNKMYINKISQLNENLKGMYFLFYKETL